MITLILMFSMLDPLYTLLIAEAFKFDVTAIFYPSLSILATWPW